MFLSFCLFIIYSIVITAADQIITSNITPFIMVCLIIGAAFLVRPLPSLLIFSSAYIVFFFAITITTNQEAAIISSNRMNGLTSTGVSFLISFIMWKYNQINIMQKRRIEKQQNELEKANKELEILAYNDPLTGLLNRRYFDDIVNKEIGAAARRKHESCLIMLDIDYFKKNKRLVRPPGRRRCFDANQQASFMQHKKIRFPLQNGRRRIPYPFTACGFKGMQDGC